jgi:DNA-binding HxlR family transcriptional regulator
MDDPGDRLPHPGYSSPKRGVLLLLKQQPNASLEEIARGLGVSKVAALGHLQHLESDGMVERSYQSGHVGRPRLLFRLTERGGTLFPQAAVPRWGSSSRSERATSPTEIGLASGPVPSPLAWPSSRRFVRKADTWRK